MMTMLHSVWSGGGSAAGRRKSLLALGALLAMIATVLVMAAPSSQAQTNESAPVAIAAIGPVDSDDLDSNPNTPPRLTVLLDGGRSFDPQTGVDTTDDACASCTYRWEVVTEAYADWLGITSVAAATDATDATLDVSELGAVTDTDAAGSPYAKFTVPNAATLARFGGNIEFRLTVWDGNPQTTAGVLSDTATVVYRAGDQQGPTADVTLTAFTAAPPGSSFEFYDDDGDGQVDELDERYTTDAIISGPGEDGNADYEWHIREGAWLVIDGMGSSDPDGLITNYRWQRVYGGDPRATQSIIQVRASLPGNDDSTTPANMVEGATLTKISTSDLNNDRTEDASVTIAPLTNDLTTLRAADGTPLTDENAANNGTESDPVRLYYRLTVTDNHGQTDSADVLIVVHDQPADPRAAVAVTATTAGTGTTDLTQATVTGNRYVVPPGSTVRLVATGSDADGGALSAAGTGLRYSWAGAEAVDTNNTINHDGDDGTTPEISGSDATIRIPATATRGQEFEVTVTTTDRTRRSSETVVTLVAVNNQRPEAVAPADITRNDGANGGDIGRFNVATGRVALRGLGFDPDGDDLTFMWSELTYPTIPVDDNDDDSDPTTPAGNDDSDSTTPDPADADDRDPRNDPNLQLTYDDDNDSGTPEVARDPIGIVLPRTSVIAIDNADAESASFAAPEVNARTQKISTAGAIVVPIRLTVIDSWGVAATDDVVVTIVNEEVSRPIANAGPDQQATSGSFVRLNGARSTPVNPPLDYTWTYIGIETDPLTQERPALSPAEEAQGFREGVWFPYNGISYILIDHDGDDDVDGAEGNDGVKDTGEVNAGQPATPPRAYQVWSDHILNDPDENGNFDDAEMPMPNSNVYRMSALNRTGSPDGADGVLGTADDPVPVDFRVLPDNTNLTQKDDDGVATTPANDDAEDSDTSAEVLPNAEDGVLDEPTGDADEIADDARSGQYHPTAGGELSNPGGSGYPYSSIVAKYPYFDAPALLGFNHVKLNFQLSVRDNETTHLAQFDTDTVVISITDGFYSGNITGPDFCIGFSLGGSRTFPNDANGDGVADQCSLNTTRRATIARQNALETLAALNPEEFKTALHGATAVSRDGTCDTAPSDLGDDQAKLDADACGPAGAFLRRVSTPPAPVDPAIADVFFSGVITGPNYCTNRSLGGQRLYANDADGDGVAEQCSLGYTRREAVARQNALETFATHAQYAESLAASCAALGSIDFGDRPQHLAADECSVPRPAPPGPPPPPPPPPHGPPPPPARARGGAGPSGAPKSGIRVPGGAC